MQARGALMSPRFASNAHAPLIGRATRVLNPQFISVGDGCVFEDLAEIQGLSTNGLHFAGSNTVGRGAMIRPSGYYSRRPGMGLTIGMHSSIGPDCYIGCSGQITVGANVMLAPSVNLFAEEHIWHEPEKPIKEQGVTACPIVVEDDCWIGSGSVITGGVTIGEGSVVGAGSVVTRDVPRRTVVAGVPARVLHER